MAAEDVDLQPRDAEVAARAEPLDLLSHLLTPFGVRPLGSYSSKTKERKERIVQRIRAGAHERQEPSLSLIHTAARLYYEDDLSQDEVAAQLGLSRSTISRFLERARQLDMVRIEVRQLSQPDALGAVLSERLGLRRAEVVEAASGPAALSALGAPVSRILDSLPLRKGSVVGLGSGRTIWQAVRAGLPSMPGAVMVPLIGGIDEVAPYYQVNETVRLAARASNATPTFIHAPAMPSLALRKAIMADPECRRRLELWDGIDVALVGVGRSPATLGDYGPAHAPRNLEQIAGAAGDVLSHYYDLEGRPVRYPEERQLLAATREQLKSAGMVIGVVAGVVKAPGIVGAARAGLIHAIVTEAMTAEAVLALLDGSKGDSGSPPSRPRPNTEAP
jgi:DNA-binding transcriptional regulator LsrR (DeoR family)